MRRLVGIVIALWISTAFGAEQETNTNVVSTAEDAFGITLGPESLGLYSASNVRGFSPLTAGNVRLDGLYFDQQGSMSDRLVTDTRIRVGLSAVDFPWPAPTGIVDYTLRKPKDTSDLTAIAYLGPYSSRDFDLDGSTNLWDKHFGVEAGASDHSDESLPGFTTHFASFAVLPQWTPNEDLTISTFWGRQNFTDYKTLPTIYLGAGQRPPRIPLRFFGQNWTTADFYNEHFGMLAYAKLGGNWIVRAGVFRSIGNSIRSYADLYENTSAAGIGDHSIIAYPAQYNESTSGEIQFSRTLVRGVWSQKMDFGVRGRDMHARYGGSESFDFGMGQAGKTQALARPVYDFGPTTADNINDYSPEASYSLRWNDTVSFIAGVRRPNYSRAVEDPILGRSTTSVKPWLYNSSIAILPTKSLSLFAALTRGLEDSGIAPANAINRGEILGAVRSSEVEVGAKYALTSSFTLLAGLFDVQKPYFALDARDVFGSLGEERHRGAELSLTGEITPGLHLVAGALFLTPEVLARSTPQQVIGSRPVGQPNRLSQVSVDYVVAWLPKLSIDGSLTALGRRPASVDNSAEISGYVSANFGARYRMDLDRHTAVLRVEVGNVNNAYNWNVQNDGSLSPIQPRLVWTYLTVDLW